MAVGRPRVTRSIDDLERQRPVRAIAAHRKAGADIADGGKREKPPEHGGLVGGHVRDHDLDEEVDVSRHQVAGHDFGHRQNGLDESIGLILRMALDFDAGKNGQPKSDRGPAEDRPVALDNALLFEKANPPRAGRGR